MRMRDCCSFQASGPLLHTCRRRLPMRMGTIGYLVFWVGYPKNLYKKKNTGILIYRGLSGWKEKVEKVEIEKLIVYSFLLIEYMGTTVLFSKQIVLICMVNNFCLVVFFTCFSFQMAVERKEGAKGESSPCQENMRGWFISLFL